VFPLFSHAPPPTCKLVSVYPPPSFRATRPFPSRRKATFLFLSPALKKQQFLLLSQNNLLWTLPSSHIFLRIIRFSRFPSLLVREILLSYPLRSASSLKNPSARLLRNLSFSRLSYVSSSLPSSPGVKSLVPPQEVRPWRSPFIPSSPRRRTLPLSLLGIWAAVLSFRKKRDSTLYPPCPFPPGSSFSFSPDTPVLFLADKEIVPS